MNCLSRCVCACVCVCVRVRVRRNLGSGFVFFVVLCLWVGLSLFLARETRSPGKRQKAKGQPPLHESSGSSSMMGAGGGQGGGALLRHTEAVRAVPRPLRRRRRWRERERHKTTRRCPTQKKRERRREREREKASCLAQRGPRGRAGEGEGERRRARSQGGVTHTRAALPDLLRVHSSACVRMYKKRGASARRQPQTAAATKGVVLATAFEGGAGQGPFFLDRTAARSPRGGGGHRKGGGCGFVRVRVQDTCARTRVQFG